MPKAGPYDGAAVIVFQDLHGTVLVLSLSHNPSSAAGLTTILLSNPLVDDNLD